MMVVVVMAQMGAVIIAAVATTATTMACGRGEKSWRLHCWSQSRETKGGWDEGEEAQRGGGGREKGMSRRFSTQVDEEEDFGTEIFKEVGERGGRICLFGVWFGKQCFLKFCCLLSLYAVYYIL